MADNRGKRVLYVERDPTEAARISERFREWGWVVERIADGGHAMSLWARGFDRVGLEAAVATVPVAVVAHRPPEIDARAVLEARRRADSVIPTIILAADLDAERAVELMRLGASDVIVRSPLDDERLRLALGRIDAGPALADATPVDWPGLLETTLAGLDQGCGVFGRDLRLRAWNDLFFELNDYPRSLARVGTPLSALVEVDAARQAHGPEAAQAGAEREGLAARSREVRVLPDGRLLEVRRHPVARGGFVATYTDITSRWHCEQQRALAASVMEHAASAMMITDGDNRIVAVNPAFTRTTGYEPGEIVGRTPEVLAPGRRDRPDFEAVEQALGESDRFGGEIWMRRKTGEIFAVRLSVAVRRDHGGRIIEGLSIFSDLSDLSGRTARFDQIWHQANFDALTELPNRTLLMDRLRHAMALAQRQGNRVALMYIDLDRFKLVNDTLGHRAGDKLLQEAGRRLRDCVRESDTVARLGGDEFVIVLPDVSAARDAETVARKVLERLAASFELDGHDASVSASIGVTLCPDDGGDVDTLLQNADTAMYRAKERGRSTYEFFTPEMNARALERAKLERELRQVLARDELVLFYQPIVDLQTDEVTGVEALVRWQHPERGLLLPADFVPLALETGLIRQIGEWVLRAACRQMMAWRADGLPRLALSVNVSGREWREGKSLEHIGLALQETGFPASDLTLDINESVLLLPFQDVLDRIQAMKRAGIRHSLDDFGTGRSPLTELRRFPVDVIKIDRSFVSGATASPDDAVVAQALIGVAHSLRCPVVAEGVETQAQLDFVRANRCEQAQGYFLGKPLAPADFVEFFAKGRAGIDPR